MQSKLLLTSEIQLKPSNCLNPNAPSMTVTTQNLTQIQSKTDPTLKFRTPCDSMIQATPKTQISDSNITQEQQKQFNTYLIDEQAMKQ